MQKSKGDSYPMLAEQFDAFLFDLDGVIYLEEKPLPGARESLAKLRDSGKRIRFLTNDPRSTRKAMAHQLVKMGIDANVEELITSGWATAKHLHQNDIRSAYVVGSRGLVAEIIEVGVEVVDKGPCEAVIIGTDEHASYGHIHQASQLISQGARFIATNADGYYPTLKGPLPATGAFVEAIKKSTGKQPTVVGKPYPLMFDMAFQGLDTEIERIAMVGDTPETDILGAHQVGITGILISKEEPQFPSPRDFRRADATIPDLTGLFDTQVTARRWERAPFPWPGKVEAGVTAVVFDRSGRVLLAKGGGSGLWELPSGRVEPGETIGEAVGREVLERTGFTVNVVRLIGVYSDPAYQIVSYPTGEVTQHITSCFHCEVVDGAQNRLEAPNAAFFATDELPTDLVPMQPGLLSHALAEKQEAFFDNGKFME